MKSPPLDADENCSLPDIWRLRTLHKFVEFVDSEAARVVSGGLPQVILDLDVPLSRDLFSQRFIDAVNSMKLVASKLITYKEMLRDEKARSLLLRELRNTDHR